VNTSLKSMHIKYGGDVFEKHEKLGFFIANAICQHPTLETLDLSFNHFTPDTAYYLGRALLRNKTIKYLNLSGNNFSDKTAAAFINALTLHHSLESLNLSNCNLGRSSAISLCKLFKKANSLKEVILDGNSFQGPVGLVILLQGLQNATLDYFSIGNCGIDDSIALQLSEGVRAGNVKGICISSNNLTDAAGVPIVRSLSRSKIATIVLDNNKFGRLTGLELESLLLKESTHLRRLSFMDNNLDEEDLMYFAASFSQNPYLRELYIGIDGFIPEFTLASERAQQTVMAFVKPEKTAPVNNNQNNPLINNKFEKFATSPAESERESLNENEPLILSNNSTRNHNEDAPLLF